MSAKILIVEDNDNNRYLASLLLRKAGHTVIEASDGEAAIELVAKERPDLVLMDIMMPKMDGYEAARRICATPGLEKTLLVAVTSYVMPGDRQKALAAGFAGYIEKPIVTSTFASQIAGFLEAAPSSP
jgi:two-component system cell cycle response regulator DivK